MYAPSPEPGCTPHKLDGLNNVGAADFLATHATMRDQRALNRDALDMLNTTAEAPGIPWVLSTWHDLDAMGHPTLHPQFVNWLCRHDSLTDYPKPLVIEAFEWMASEFPAYGRVVDLAYWERLSLRAAGERLGIHHDTVREHKNEGLKWMHSFCSDEVKARRLATGPTVRLIHTPGLVDVEPAARVCEQCDEPVKPHYKTRFATGIFCSKRCATAFDAAR